MVVVGTEPMSENGGVLSVNVKVWMGSSLQA